MIKYPVLVPENFFGFFTLCYDLKFENLYQDFLT